MQRARYSLFGLCFVALAVVLIGCPPPPTVYVDDDSTCSTGCGTAENPWPTIEQGIANAPAGPVTVSVAAGIYNEWDLSPASDMSVVAPSGAGATIIDMLESGPSATRKAFLVWGDVDNVTIQGFTIRGGNQAINVWGWDGSVAAASNITITGNNFTNVYYGAVQITQADGVTVSGNTFMAITDDHFIATAGTGAGATNAVFDGNTIDLAGSAGGIGLSFGDGSDAVVSNNTIVNAPDHGIFVTGGGSGGATALIQGNLIAGCANAIHTNGAAAVTVTGNEIGYNSSNGLHLVSTGSVSVTNNVKIEGNGEYGIYCGGGITNITCSNNNISGNGSGPIGGCPGGCVN